MKCFLIVLLVCVGQICGAPKNETNDHHNGTEHPLSPFHHNGTEHPLSPFHHNGTEHHYNGTVRPPHDWLKVRYCTWKPVNNQTVSNCIKVEVPVNTTFYDVMMIAQQQDPSHFAFTSTLYPGMGHYITSIGGLQQDQAKKMYWMIYVLHRKPNVKFPPTAQELSPVGVDELIVQPKTSYLFWYQHSQH